MKRKEDDLARLDGKMLPTWLKVLVTIIAFVVSFLLFSFLLRIL